MTRIVSSIALMVLLAACGQGPAQETSAHEFAETVITNGKVYTADDDQPWAEAIAISGDSITYVGDGSGVESLIGESTEIIDAGGKMVTPGFVDGHNHAVAGGLIMQGVDLQSDDLDELMAKIKAEVESNDAEVIMGYGIRFTPFPDGFPTAAMLDEIESERPMYLWGITGHAAWVNSRTLEIAGINKDTPETVPGYSYFERDDDGNPTGWIVELPAQMQVLTSLITPDVPYMKAGVQGWLSRFSAAGITSLQDMGIQGMTTEDGFQMFTDLATDGELPIRVRGVYYWNDPSIDPVAEFDKLAARFTHPRMTPNKIKINIDGGDDGYNALYVDGYVDKPDLDPDPIIPVDIINDAVARGDAKGIDAVCHCFGDGAVRIMLDAIEAAMAANPDRDRRFAVSHGNSVHADDIARFGELGVGYDTSGAWMSYDPNLQSVSDGRLGTQRVQEMFPAQKIIDAGGRFSLGSDWPVSGYVSEYRPLVAIETAVTRTLDGRKDVPPLGGAEAGVSLESALKAATINAAVIIGIEDIVGSLEVGKKADLIMLSENLFEIDPNDISEVDVLLTISGGKVVHKAD